MRHACTVCGYVYDDDVEGTPFDDLPDDWTCPLCGAPKDLFQLVVEEPPAPEPEPSPAPKPELEPKPTTEPADDLQLSAGQLAAVLSNLARGCEKQYKPEEAQLFARLADYFTARVEPVEDATVSTLAELLGVDIAQGYPAAKSTAQAEGDRGAQRICVWGERVTRMLSSLVTRYLDKGEDVFEGTIIWVCTVCGFVYVGDKAPEQCPVCKVPASKFEKVEGRR